MVGQVPAIAARSHRSCLRSTLFENGLQAVAAANAKSSYSCFKEAVVKAGLLLKRYRF